MTEVLDIEMNLKLQLYYILRELLENPKGVMLTYENILANINGVKNVNLVTDKDVILLRFYLIIIFTFKFYFNYADIFWCTYCYLR